MMNLEHPVRAVLLDVDGTLYYQAPLRCLIALELCTLPITKGSYQSTLRQWQLLRYFRRVREELRHLTESITPLAELQYAETAKMGDVTSHEVENVVIEWIHQRPLKYLRLCRRRGIEAFFSFLEKNGVRIGVFSDYPVVDKLRALGLSKSVSLTLCATDPEINAFKPQPQGFWHACALWKVAPEEVLYVGDRLEVDAVGAVAAGMPCALMVQKLGRFSRRDLGKKVFTFSSFSELHYALLNSLEC
jgi:HAD superfamily hydrolase (TIGR01549 family)